MNAPFPRPEPIIRNRPPRAVLLLAHEFVAQYRVLRCAAMTGAQVHVMGPEKARGLALSRFCTAYHPYFLGHEEYLGLAETVDPRVVAEHVDSVARANGIEMVLASDALTTRLLAEMQPHLKTPSFPVPPVEIFDALATKDAFIAFCRDHDLLHPTGQVFESVDALREAVDTGQVRFPAMLKPVNRAGSIGVTQVNESNVRDVMTCVDYAPILVQDFIAGEDRSITVMAIDSDVVKDVVYWHPDGVFHFAEEPALSATIAKIVRDLNLSGVFNFDARIGLDGRIWMIECNPRFFFNMDVAAVAGMNFAALHGIVPGVRAVLTHSDMRVPQATLRGMLHGRFPNASDRKILKHWLADPLVFALVSVGFPRRWRSERLERIAAHLKQT